MRGFVCFRQVRIDRFQDDLNTVQIHFASLRVTSSSDRMKLANRLVPTLKQHNGYCERGCWRDGRRSSFSSPRYFFMVLAAHEHARIGSRERFIRTSSLPGQAGCPLNERRWECELPMRETSASVPRNPSVVAPPRTATPAASWRQVAEDSTDTRNASIGWPPRHLDWAFVPPLRFWFKVFARFCEF